MKVSRENYVRGARMRKIWGEEALDFQASRVCSRRGARTAACAGWQACVAFARLVSAERLMHPC